MNTYRKIALFTLQDVRILLEADGRLKSSPET